MLAITGYSGFIGRAIADKLPLPQRHFVRPSDLSNHHDIIPFLDGATTLLHLACKSTPRNSISDPTLPITSDLQPSIDLFETFAKQNPNGHIVFASTGGNMYSSTKPHVPRIETDLPMPGSPYSVQKLAVEGILRLLCQQYGIKATILRISNPYGVLLPSSRGQGVIGVTFSKLLNGETLPIFDSPYSVRDYLYMDDLAEAFKIAIEQPPQNGECRLFNVGSGVGYRLQDVLELIEKVTQTEIKKEYLPSSQIPMEDASWSVISPKLIASELGWKPEIALEEGLQLMWQKSI